MMIHARPATRSDDEALANLTRVAWDQPDADPAPIPDDELAAWFVAELDDGSVSAAAAGQRRGSVSDLWLVRAIEGSTDEEAALAALDALTQTHIGEGATAQRFRTPREALHPTWLLPLLARVGFDETELPESERDEMIEFARPLF